MTAREDLPQGEMVVARNSDDAWKLGAGRRDFIAYRDMGMLGATHGRINIQGSYIREGGKAKETGWHYHTCDYQIVYVLEGWVDMQFREGETIRIQAGDCINIPPGTPQNETAISDGFRCLEIRSPEHIGTVACDPPK